jgi:hypothetical protein
MFIEHHIEIRDLLHFTLPDCTLGSTVRCVYFVRKDIQFSKIIISHNCKETDLQIRVT